ncbi:MAG: tetratricopeptide repeat protein [Bryobacteraceae bacterium]
MALLKSKWQLMAFVCLGVLAFPLDAKTRPKPKAETGPDAQQLAAFRQAKTASLNFVVSACGALSPPLDSRHAGLVSDVFQRAASSYGLTVVSGNADVTIQIGGCFAGISCSFMRVDNHDVRTNTICGSTVDGDIVLAVAGTPPYKVHYFGSAKEQFDPRFSQPLPHDDLHLGSAIERSVGAKLWSLLAQIFGSPEERCEAGNVPICIALGSEYERGGLQEQDSYKASVLYYRLCKEGHSEGCSSLLKQNGAECNRFFVSRCFSAGGAYENGMGAMPPDMLLAVNSYAAGCRQGMGGLCAALEKLRQNLCEQNGWAEECDYLGQWFAKGEGAENQAKAAQFYRKACDGGSASGCAHLGVPAGKGEGAPPTSRHVGPTYPKACDEGDIEACPGDGERYYYGDGVAKDLAKAAQLYNNACDGGHAAGCYWLGLMHHFGKGLPKDDAKAAPLYQKACEGGHIIGCTALGYLYLGGDGVPLDEVKAAQLFEQACTRDDAWGCNNLAWAYERGSGVEKDEATAIRFYQKACYADYAYACDKLGKLYAKGAGTAQDINQAMQLYRKACEGGNAQGCYDLGALYSAGTGVKQDRGEAARLYRKACDGGIEAGCAAAKKTGE